MKCRKCHGIALESGLCGYHDELAENPPKKAVIRPKKAKENAETIKKAVEVAIEQARSRRRPRCSALGSKGWPCLKAARTDGFCIYHHPGGVR